MDRPVVLAIPTLNEAESIGSLLPMVPHGCAIAQATGATIITTGCGHGRACFVAAETAAADAIMVYMDDDGADDPDGIAALIDPIVAGAHDFVIGSRVTGTRENGSMGWPQVLAGRGIGLAVRLLYRARHTDVCAFRVIGRDTLPGLGMRERIYGWNLETRMRAVRRWLHILEGPVANRCRIRNLSKVAGSVRSTLRAGTKIIATFVRVASERSNMTEAGS